MKNCNQCGKCCLKYGDGALSANTEEIELWRVFQPEIYQYVHNGEIWCDPQSKQKLHRCPFLRIDGDATKTPTVAAQQPLKYTCAIYLDRPEDCRHYPTSIAEMVQDDCEMIEPADLKYPQRAQKKLDILMSDSRPAKS